MEGTHDGERRKAAMVPPLSDAQRRIGEGMHVLVVIGYRKERMYKYTPRPGADGRSTETERGLGAIGRAYRAFRQ